MGFFFPAEKFCPAFDDMCKYEKERREELIDSIKTEQQIPANCECSIFNGWLLKIKEKSRQNKREVLLDRIDSCYPH